MTKVININGQRFVLPEGMSSKDIQALAGFLLTLTAVQSEYNWDTSEYMNFASDRGAEVRIESVDLMDRAVATAQHRDSYQRHCEKKAAEKAAA